MEGDFHCLDIFESLSSCKITTYDGRQISNVSYFLEKQLLVGQPYKHVSIGLGESKNVMW